MNTNFLKVIVLHPPMYPVNHRFYNLLSERTNLIVYQFGESPEHHPGWNDKEIRKDGMNYKLKIFGKDSMSFKRLTTHFFIFDVIRDKPDFVISIAFGLPSLYSSFLKYFLNFKFIISTDMIATTEANISDSKQFLRNFIANKVNAFISASNLTSEYLESFYSKQKSFLSLQTIDVANWVLELNQIPAENVIKKRLNITNGKVIMLGVGNFIKKKNWLSVLNNMKDIENVHFILIGSGCQKDDYKRVVLEEDMAANVSIVNRKDGKELLEYFKVSDFLIFPSYYDQFGYVVCESLASGLPVICTKNSGASCLIENDVNGYIIDPKSDFTKEIEKMTVNYKNFSINAKNTMMNRTLEKKVEEYISIMEFCLNSKSGS